MESTRNVVGKNSIYPNFEFDMISYKKYVECRPTPKYTYGDIIAYIEKKVWPIYCKTDDMKREFCVEIKNFFLNENKLYYQNIGPDLEYVPVLVVCDLSTQFEIMKQFHCAFHVPNQSHKQFNELYNILLTKYYWFNMMDDIKNFISNCVTCNPCIKLNTTCGVNTSSKYASRELTDSVNNSYSHSMNIPSLSNFNATKNSTISNDYSVSAPRIHHTSSTPSPMLYVPTFENISNTNNIVSFNKNSKTTSNDFFSKTKICTDNNCSDNRSVKSTITQQFSVSSQPTTCTSSLGNLSDETSNKYIVSHPIIPKNKIMPCSGSNYQPLTVGSMNNQSNHPKSSVSVHPHKSFETNDTTSLITRNSGTTSTVLTSHHPSTNINSLETYKNAASIVSSLSANVVSINKSVSDTNFSYPMPIHPSQKPNNDSINKVAISNNSTGNRSQTNEFSIQAFIDQLKINKDSFKSNFNDMLTMVDDMEGDMINAIAGSQSSYSKITSLAKQLLNVQLPSCIKYVVDILESSELSTNLDPSNTSPSSNAKNKPEVIDDPLS